MLNMPVPHPHSFEGYETKTVDELEYKVALGDCVKLYHQSDMVEKNCSNCKSLGPHSKVKTIKKFPKYLTVVFDIKSVIGWVPRKLHALFHFRNCVPEVKRVFDSILLPVGRKFLVVVC